jgi:hypothetical protein
VVDVLPGAFSGCAEWELGPGLMGCAWFGISRSASLWARVWPFELAGADSRAHGQSMVSDGEAKEEIGSGRSCKSGRNLRNVRRDYV